MKSFVNYINEKLNIISEKFNKKIVTNVVVQYDFPDYKFKLNAPDTYEESDIQQYLDDYILSKLPNNSDIGKKAFGINFSFLSDAYFEYDKYEKLNSKLSDIDLEWNNEYANDNIDKDETLNTFILYNFKYIIKFDKFDIMYDEDIKEELNNLFSSYESNNNNNYPIELKYNKDELLYTE